MSALIAETEQRSRWPLGAALDYIRSVLTNDASSSGVNSPEWTRMLAIETNSFWATPPPHW
jgi:hypothetical protein